MKTANNNYIIKENKMAIRIGGKEMLCQFSFKNFKSYKEETTFDFQATSIPEFSDSLIVGNKEEMCIRDRK